MSEKETITISVKDEDIIKIKGSFIYIDATKIPNLKEDLLYNLNIDEGAVKSEFGIMLQNSNLRFVMPLSRYKLHNFNNIILLNNTYNNSIITLDISRSNTFFIKTSNKNDNIFINFNSDYKLFLSQNDFVQLNLFIYLNNPISDKNLNVEFPNQVQALEVSPNQIIQANIFSTDGGNIWHLGNIKSFDENDFDINSLKYNIIEDIIDNPELSVSNIIEITTEEFLSCNTLGKYRALMSSKFSKFNYTETNIAIANFNYSSTYGCPSVVYDTSYNTRKTLFNFKAPKIKTVKFNVVYAPFYNGQLFSIGSPTQPVIYSLLQFHFSSYYGISCICKDRSNTNESGCSDYAKNYFTTPRLLEATNFLNYYKSIKPDSDGYYTYTVESNGNLIYINYLYIEFEDE